MLIKDLDIHDKPSLMHYIDDFTREDLGSVYSDYTCEDLKRITNKLVSHYNLRKNDYPQIVLAFEDEQFISDVEDRISQFLDNRPQQERIDLYSSLCKKYGLPEKMKKAINKSKLEARISKIIETDGASQDI